MSKKLKHKLIDKSELTKFMLKHPNTQSVEPVGNKIKVTYLKSA